MHAQQMAAIADAAKAQSMNRIDVINGMLPSCCKELWNWELYVVHEVRYKLFILPGTGPQQPTPPRL